jgi:hypothetical protein
VPIDDPGGSVHVEPPQQSADVVQEPPVAMHAPLQTNIPAVLAVQGIPQQSALLPHGVPAGGGLAQSIPAPAQRGMPRLSWMQVFEQQLFSALHEVVLSLQTWPALRQDWPLSHLPIV